MRLVTLGQVTPPPELLRLVEERRGVNSEALLQSIEHTYSRCKPRVHLLLADTLHNPNTM